MIFCDDIFVVQYSAILSTGNLVELSSTKGRKQLISCQRPLSTKDQQIWNSTRSKVSSFAMWCCRWVYDFVLRLNFSGRSLWPRGDVPPVSTFDQQLADHLLADHHLGVDHPPGQRLLQELLGRRHPSQPYRPPRSGNLVSCPEFFWSITSLTVLSVSPVHFQQLRMPRWSISGWSFVCSTHSSRYARIFKKCLIY